MNFFVSDIGGTNLRIAIVDDNGTLQYVEKFQTPRSYEELLKMIVSKFEEIYNHFKPECGCVSVAGAVLEDETVWLPNVFGTGYRLKEKLQKLLGINTYFIDDRTAGLLGEVWKGKAKGFKDVGYLIIGTGVGLGILMDGKIIKGAKGVAGSVGWINIGTFKSSTFENTNIENFISGPAILRRFNKSCDEALENTRSIFEFYEKTKNECAQTIIDETSIAIGKLLAIIANVLNPELFILGGSIGEKWQYFKEKALEVFEIETSPLAKDVHIEVSNLGEKAQILGCAKYATERGKGFVSI